MRAAPLGNFVIWATFNPDDSTHSPFGRLPFSHAAICTALALGDADASLVLLAWGHADSGSPPLHRPTVADAGLSQYYRPHPEPTCLWGFTHPLPPNPESLQPQPELVMPEIDSRGLRLPFRVVQA